jgi:molybdopterin-guanine dinucleotide biosynthesis protein A
MKTAGFVLAGGRSTRMGRDKSLLILNGETLIQRALRTLAEVCAEVAIAGGAPHLAQFGRLIPDPIPDSGPLTGIVAALEQSTCEWNLFLAVDVPFVPREAWQQILAIATQTEAIAVMSRARGEVQPLCAAYHRSAAPALRSQLESGNLKVTRAAEAAGSIAYADFENVAWFRNFNTPSEFEQANSKSTVSVPE